MPRNTQDAVVFLLRDSRISSSVLEQLWSRNDLNLITRSKIPAHHAATLEQLKLWSRHESHLVRDGVLKNQNVESKILMEMIRRSRKKETQARRPVGKNTAQGKALRDIKQANRQSVGYEENLRVKIAAHPNADESVLALLGNDRRLRIKEAVVRNNKASTETLLGIVRGCMYLLGKKDRGGASRIHLETIAGIASTTLHRRGVRL